MPLVKLVKPSDITGRAMAINAECFGKQDPYSKATAYSQDVKILEKKGLAYLLYRVFPDYISIDRLGTVKAHRKKGHSKSLMRSLKRIARKEKKPIRTYIRYDNLSSYLLHISSGFYPTHVAWNTWVWVEYKPKTVEV